MPTAPDTITLHLVQLSSGGSLMVREFVYKKTDSRTDQATNHYWEN